MTQRFDDFKVEVAGKLGGLTSQQYIDKHPGEHLWAHFGEDESCAFCGLMRAREGKVQKPCRGIVKIGLRNPVKE
jgi:hypothetical protein